MASRTFLEWQEVTLNTKDALRWTPPGKRPQGRPKKKPGAELKELKLSLGKAEAKTKSRVSKSCVDLILQAKKIGTVGR